ncbi:phage tail tube protein [Micromonospora sediminicola]|uniref:phage tail tube protein n=1 Tax=Micromonospora sediminicola TaxID=946078 RepID=UPI0037B5F36B
MALNVSLIRAYTNGLVAVTAAGDTSVTLPTTASAGLSADFFDIGTVTSDGISEATSQDRTDIFAWQGAALVRRIPGQYTKTFTFAAAETSLLTLGVQFPGSTITQTSEGASVAEKPPTTDIRSWVLHGTDGTRAQRIVVPQGEVTERGDVVWNAEDITVYQWTLSAYLDGNSVACYRYYLDSSMAA